MESLPEKVRSQRRNWAGRLVAMHETAEIEVLPGAPSELVQLCFELSELAAEMGDQTHPSCRRSEMPGRLVVARIAQ